MITKRYNPPHRKLTREQMLLPLKERTALRNKKYKPPNGYACCHEPTGRGVGKRCCRFFIKVQTP